ncbi:MAG: 2-oxoacid:acceptor oxidoreductase family protein [Oscillospiraceae bacterium]|nr:2-oxoacid:acceptor oxidoreductase family protein [Oscillospiraceae bacterium]
MAEHSKTSGRQAAYEVSLPYAHQNGCYEMRLESIGGLGANLCGKLLGELGAKYLGLNAAAFSSYGSEKRGSPVKSYVRLSAPQRDILHNSPVERPHMLVLFHHALSKTLPVTAGVEENCIVVVNTNSEPEKVREELKLYGGTVCCVDALSLALETKSRVNMVMLGAVTKASGFIPLEAVKDAVSDTLGKKYPALLENNLKGIMTGYKNVKIKIFEPDGKFEKVPYREVKSKWGYKNAPLGGANVHFGSTVSNDLSPSREGYIPLFIFEKCIHCGLCDSTCPDMVFQFTEGEYKGKSAMINSGLDYHHCKGCLRCVEVCPTEALVAGKESEHPQKQWFVRNKDLIAENIDFEPAGADAYITSEAYLDEKRVDGGLM